MGANPHFLSLRLSTEDSRIVERLHGQLGLSKSDLVKRALRLLAEQIDGGTQADAYTAGVHLFGRHGNAQRQSSHIKDVVRQVLDRKRRPLRD